MKLGQIKIIRRQILRVIEKLPGVNLYQVLVYNGTYYLLTPKIGTRSLRDLVRQEKSKYYAWKYIEYYTPRQILHKFSKEKLVVITRDPLDRLHSCWKQKVRQQVFPGYFWQYFPLLRPGMSFLDFLKALKKISPGLSEKHFRPQFYGLNIESLTIELVPLSYLSNYLRKQYPGREIYESNRTGGVEFGLAESKYFRENLLEKYLTDRQCHELAQMFEDSGP